MNQGFVLGLVLFSIGLLFALSGSAVCVLFFILCVASVVSGLFEEKPKSNDIR